MDPIKNLLHSYSDAVCRQDVEQWLSTWTDTGVWDLGHGDPAEGKETLKSSWLSAMSRFEAVFHTYSNNSADLNEENGTGFGRSYVTEWIRPNGGESKLLHGFYDDQYVRTEGVWLFQRRTLNRVYFGKPDFSS